MFNKKGGYVRRVLVFYINISVSVTKQGSGNPQMLELLF